MRLAPLMLCALITGCSGFNPLPRGESLAVLADSQPAAPIRVKTTSTMVGDGPDQLEKSADGVGGVVDTFGRLACSLWNTCAPVGAFEEDLEILVKKMAAYERERVLQAELVAAVDEKSRDRWNVVAGSSPNSLTVQLTGVSLVPTQLGNFALEMTAFAVVRRRAAAWPGNAQWLGFRYQTPSSPLERWIADDEFVRASFDHAYRQLADQMVSALTDNRSR